MTVAFISHRYFGGNYQATLSFLKASNQSLFKNLLSKSRFTRRLHRWFGLLPSLFHLVSELKRKISLSSLYFIDSLPVSVCENIRIRRCKLAKGEQYRGYIASKRVYFYGLRVHIICDEEKFVHEFVIVDGRLHDLEGWANASLYYLSEGDKVIADSAYTRYDFEEEMRREGIEWEPIRRKGSRRYQGEEFEAWKRRARRVVETVGSVLRLYLGKRIQAVTLKGFLLKIMMAIISYNLHRLFCLVF